MPSASAEVDAEGRAARAAEIAARLRENIETVVHGKTEEIRPRPQRARARHVLFEDVPGTAKTVLARAIAQSVEGAIPSRIQCTPDLQPNDVTGLSIYNQKVREFEFQPGPIFANVVLVDEINRAMPKTQVALLEAMAEQQVTTDGLTRRLPSPFLLLATENPIEYGGRPAPRGAARPLLPQDVAGVSVPRRRAADHRRPGQHHRARHARAGRDGRGGRAALAAVRDVYLDPLLGRWIVELVRATRESPAVAVGASVRGSLARAGRARLGALHDRAYVTPVDVEHLFLPVLGHRVVFHAEDAGGRLAHRLDVALAEFRASTSVAIPPPSSVFESDHQEPAAG